MAQDTKQYDELAKQYGFAPVPESVSRLTQLVAQQYADLDEIASVIQGDPVLTKRLLRVVNSHATCEAEYTIDTVEQAIMRNGMGGALILAMGTPLALALQKACTTSNTTTHLRYVRAATNDTHLHPARCRRNHPTAPKRLARARDPTCRDPT